MDLVVMPVEQLRTLLVEACSIALKHNHHPLPVAISVDPYGDFKWLLATCQGIPSSTLRIKSASGEIPGVVKVGKRVLYEKAVVLEWLRSQTRTIIDSTIIEKGAEAQFNWQLNKKGGERV